VIVGNAQGRERRFPVYEDLPKARSNFLLAARTAEPEQSVCLEPEDPDVISLYLNCVHSGMKVVRAEGELLGKRFHIASDGARNLIKRERDSEESAEEDEDDLDGGRFEALIKLHMLARTLQDFEMMNSAIDELVRMVDEDGLIPTQVNLVYTLTSRGDVLRTLVRDVYIHEAESSECHEFLQTSELHSDFWREVSLEYFRLKDTEKSVGDVYGLKIGKDKGVSRCDYYQRLPDNRVELPHTTSATATAIRMENHAPAVLQASGHTDDPSVAATASTGTVQERAPLPPQNSARRRSTTAAVTSDVHTDERAPAVPQARACSGRPVGTGTKVQRR